MEEMVRQHHQLSGHESEQTLGDGATVHGVTESWTRLSFKKKRDVSERATHTDSGGSRFMRREMKVLWNPV